MRFQCSLLQQIPMRSRWLRGFLAGFGAAVEVSVSLSSVLEAVVSVSLCGAAVEVSVSLSSVSEAVVSESLCGAVFTSLLPVREQEQ